MKTFVVNKQTIVQTVCLCLVLMTALCLACSKDDDGEKIPPVTNELLGTWQLKTLSGNATYTNGTSPYQVTEVVKGELPADMTPYNQVYTFKNDGKCVMDGDNGTYTYKDKVLTTKVGSQTSVFTLLSVDNTTLKLQMDAATSKVYAYEVANTLLKEAGDPKTCADYGIGATNASFTFILTKK